MNFSTFKNLTRIEHTLFGLPFILGGVILGFTNPLFSTAYKEGDWVHWLWIIPAFMMARVAGMSFNQLIDRHIDAKNPRTEGRVLPSGKINPTQARFVAWGSWSLFILICVQINFLCAFLSVFAAFLIFIYSYMKRISASCHYVLGLIHFLGPVMAASSIVARFNMASIFLGAAAFFLIGGSDILWGLQDYEFDIAKSLKSIPSRFGPKKSFLFSRLSHFLSVLMLIGVGIWGNLNWFYYCAPAIASALFIFFHYKIWRRHEREKPLFRINQEFLLLNFSIPLTVLIFMLAGGL